ncbi:MAG TPA: glycosyltransferase family 39 protein [Oceanipulchritudo sp.]|nr:glycosyltransferase family 39 protein [Oceanipulchritudo sp.]
MNQEAPVAEKKSLPTLLSRHRFVLVLVMVAAVMRIINFSETMASPCVSSQLNEEMDTSFFYQQGQILSQGDWLLDQSMHPFHSWHAIVAEQYFQRQAGNTATMEPFHNYGQEMERKRALWDHWYGGKAYHQEPFYAYFLALLFALFGEGMAMAFLLQSMAGLACIVLIYAISGRLFSPRVAKLAGILAALYGPLLFYETVLLRATLICLTSLLLVWLTMRCQRQDKWWMWSLLGLACGVAILLKSTFLLYLASLWGILFLTLRPHLRKVLLTGGIVTATALLALLPLVARNLAVGAPPFKLSSVTPVTFVTSNIPNANPIAFAPLREGVAEIMGSTDGKFLPIVIETLKMHSVASYAGLLAGKLQGVLHWYEYPNNTNYYYHQLYSDILRRMPVTTQLILALAIPGLLLSLRRRQIPWPLLLMIAIQLLTILLVFAVSRFRLPLALSLIPFAAFAAVEIYEFVRQRQFRPALLAGALALSLFAYMGRPLPKDCSLIRPIDIQVSLNNFYGPQLLVARNQEDWELLVALWGAFMEAEPEFVRRLGEDTLPRNASEQELARIYANASEAYAEALVKTNQQAKANQVRQHGQRLAMAVADPALLH